MEERYENAAVTWTQQFCRINSFLGAGKREAVFLAEKILKESCDATVTVYDADTEEPYIIAEKTCETPQIPAFAGRSSGCGFSRRHGTSF